MICQAIGYLETLLGAGATQGTDEQIRLLTLVYVTPNAFSKNLLAAHIHTCVARDIREGKDEVIDELIDTMGKLMK